MERRKARNWYWWLWLSPLLTLPTLAALFLSEIGFALLSESGSRWGSAAYDDPGYYDICYRATILIAVLVSALWHLILLIPASDKAHPFVRWHGRQMLLLAGVRTAIPLAFALGFGEDSQALLAIPALLLLWFGGTLWGQRQAARGDCSLMRWLGQEELLSTLVEADMQIQARKQDAQALVEILRFSRDSEERRGALAELERRGMVETL